MIIETYLHVTDGGERFVATWHGTALLGLLVVLISDVNFHAPI